LVCDSVQGLAPSYLGLLIEQLLRLSEVVDLGETVALADVLQPSWPHLLSQPFPSIQTDLGRKRKPGLDTGIHESEDRMNLIVIKKKTFAQPWHQL
jgi:hypothetical protein